MDITILIPILIGCLAGWLVNYLADVLPETLKLTHPTCKNPECKQVIPWVDTLLLRGCRKCGRKRGIRSYLTILLLLAGSLYTWFVPPMKIGYALGFPLLAYLFVVAIIDMEHRSILGPLSIFGLVLAFIAGVITRGWLPTLIGGAAGFLIMFLFYQAGKIFARMRQKRLGLTSDDGEEALGSGDITLLTILGFALGWPLIWFGLFLGILFAGLISLVIMVLMLLARRYNKQALNTFIPYGPFFIIAVILMIYFPKLIGLALPGQ